MDINIACVAWAAPAENDPNTTVLHTADNETFRISTVKWETVVLYAGVLQLPEGPAAG